MRTSGRRMLVVLLVMILGCTAAWAQETEKETVKIGNDLAGYMSTDLTFYDFRSVNVPQESAEAMAEQYGYCQYMFMEEPVSGMIVTMSGYTAEMMGEGTLDDHVNGLLSSGYSSLESLYANPTYETFHLRIDEERGVAILMMKEADDTENPNLVIVGVPYDVSGQYGVYYFEAFKVTEEAVSLICDMMMTFEAGDR